LIDDQAGRHEAVRRDLPIQGTLGVLATAAQRGLINLREAIERLQRTNFRMHPALLKAIFERHGRS
jgi:predicted nucleic acid-binding protein